MDENENIQEVTVKQTLYRAKINCNKIAEPRGPDLAPSGRLRLLMIQTL